jgi:hypothetical protein
MTKKITEPPISISPTHKSPINKQTKPKSSGFKKINLSFFNIVSICITAIIIVFIICQTIYDYEERKLYYRTELEKFHISATKKQHNYYLYND